MASELYGFDLYRKNKYLENFLNGMKLTKSEEDKILYFVKLADKIFLSQIQPDAIRFISRWQRRIIFKIEFSAHIYFNKIPGFSDFADKYTLYADGKVKIINIVILLRFNETIFDKIVKDMWRYILTTL